MLYFFACLSVCLNLRLPLMIISVSIYRRKWDLSLFLFGFSSYKKESTANYSEHFLYVIPFSYEILYNTKYAREVIIFSNFEIQYSVG